MSGRTRHDRTLKMASTLVIPEVQKSNAVRRLESYNDRVSVRSGKSPEVVHKRLEDASLRAFQHVKAIVTKVRIHNIETANRVHIHRVREESNRETFRQQVLDNLEEHAVRRVAHLDHRVAHNRERRTRYEKEVKSSLARKRAMDLERAAAERSRCEKADEQRQKVLLDVINRSHALQAKIRFPSPRNTEMPPKDAEAASGLSNAKSTAISTDTAYSPSAALLSQIDEQKRLANFDSFRAWMQTPATIGLVDDVLVEHAARAQGAPHLVLDLLSLYIHAEHLLDPDADHDRIIRRESTRFVRKLRLALLAHATHHTTIDERSSLESPLPTSESTTKRSAMPAAESLAASFERARRFHRAWSSMDKPVTVDVLLTLLVALKAQQRERGASTARSNTDPDAEPPEEVFEQLRVLGGAQAEAQGRAFYEGQWQHTSATSLEETVRQIAQRAYWDAVSAHVANGRYDALWLVLRELQGAMKALCAHSERATDELDDKFDPTWLEAQVAHGALETAEVQALMGYLASMIASWQAPADAAEANRWVTQLDASLRGSEGAPLGDFIGRHLVGFVREAIARVGTIYQRLIALAAERDAEREPLAAASSAQ